MSSGRIRFANQLRGVAAVSVACSHLIGVYWAMPEVVSAATLTPLHTGALPGLFWLAAHPWFNLGPFGVGLFFLISGLVVPFSLEKHTRLTFIGARMLRIYPAYIAALLLEVVVLHLSAYGWDRPFNIPWQTVLPNALLIYDLVGHPSIDLVNWTLSVELKFYLLAAVLAPFIRQGDARALLGAGACLFAVNALMAAGLLGDAAAAPSTVSYTASSHTVCLTYMLIGVAFNFHLRGRLSTAGLVGVAGVLAAMFVGGWQLSVWRGQYPIVTANYAYALVLFAGLYAARRWVPANPVLDGMAAVSFPFYAIHSLMGYTLLRAFMVGAHLSYEAALVFTVPCLLLAAATLHVLVERPSVWAGQRLAAGPDAASQKVHKINLMRIASKNHPGS